MKAKNKAELISLREENHRLIQELRSLNRALKRDKETIKALKAEIKELNKSASSTKRRWWQRNKGGA